MAHSRLVNAFSRIRTLFLDFKYILFCFRCGGGGRGRGGWGVCVLGRGGASGTLSNYNVLIQK